MMIAGDDTMEFSYKAIGIMHSPFTEPADTLVQGTFSDAEGTVEVFPEFTAVLKDIEGFSHLFLVYHFHRATGYSLTAKPFLEGSQERGVFAIRHFRHPDPVVISIVELKKVHGNVLDIAGADILDGSPLLDVKPYISQFDCRENARSGWVDERHDRPEKPGQYTPRGPGRQ